MLEKLKAVEHRLTEVEHQLSDPAVYTDRERLTALSREQKELTPLVTCYRAYARAARTAEDAAVIRPDESGQRRLVLRAAWQGDGTGRYPWRLVLDDGANAAEYDASVPMASGGMVYLCAYPAPQQAGRRFAGWYDADGAPVETLPATAFFGERNGETDWSSPRTVTLYAHWETA